MDEFNLDPNTLQNGVYILSEIQNDFESIYLKVRDKEKRVYSDEELGNLPFASDANPYKKEWKLRTKSFQRFKKYLQTKKENLNILDLGCGNGWFCGQTSKSFNHNFDCVDVNLTELKQGRRVFDSDNINFICADIFMSEFSNSSYDIVIVNAAVQYFLSIKKLLNKLLSLINASGEIHIIDSPFYLEYEVKNARKRTADYYNSIGFPEMTKNYFHHSWDELSEFNCKILYNPNTVKKIFRKLFLINDSPFPWLKITR